MGRSILLAACTLIAVNAQDRAQWMKDVRIQSGKCSRRDLIADLYEPLAKRGIKLMVYLPAGAPNGDRDAKEALNWQNGHGKDLGHGRSALRCR